MQLTPQQNMYQILGDTLEPLYSGHHWDQQLCPLQK